MSDSTPLSFLRDSSERTLQDFELSKRAAAANHTKELRVLIGKIVDDLVEAELARRVRELRPDEDAEARNTIPALE